MPINFPSSPTPGQVFTDGDHTWEWSSTTGVSGAWKLQTQTVTGPTGPTGAAAQWDTPQTIDNKTTSYTAVSSDAGKLITMNVGSANNFTVNTTTSLSTGQRIDIIQTGTGQTTVVATGVTISSTPTLKLRAQYSAATLVCTGTNTYILMGDLAVS